jgi:hypothetical protein
VRGLKQRSFATAGGNRNSRSDPAEKQPNGWALGRSRVRRAPR